LGAGCRGFYAPFYLEVFYCAESAAHKKGGVDDLGKLRSGAKWNGAILTSFFSPD
jgi:hypothetical protein